MVKTPKKSEKIRRESFFPRGRLSITFFLREIVFLWIRENTTNGWIPTHYPIESNGKFILGIFFSCDQGVMQDSSYELLRTSLRISSEGSFLCVSVSRTIVSRSFSTRFPGIRENWKWFLTIQDFPGDFTKRRSVEDPFQDFFVCFSEYDFDAVKHKPWKQNDPDDLKRTKKCERNCKKRRFPGGFGLNNYLD